MSSQIYMFSTPNIAADPSALAVMHEGNVYTNYHQKLMELKPSLS